jgi:peptide-methionine (S)-S-oxide reductase
MAMFSSMKLRLPPSDHALPGRTEALAVPDTHFVNGNRITPPFPAGLEQALFAMG